MTGDAFVLAFGAVLAAALVAKLIKTTGGQLVISVAAAVIGAFGLGYDTGFRAGVSRYWYAAMDVQREAGDLSEIADYARLVGELTSLTLQPDLGYWMGIVSILMLAGGLVVAGPLAFQYAKQTILKEAALAERKAAQEPHE